MKKYSIKKIGLIVSDMEKSLAFYHGIAGMPILQRFPREDGGENVFLNAGALILELMSAAPGETPGTLHHLSLGGNAQMLKDVKYFREQHLEVTDVMDVEDDIHLADMNGPDQEKIRLFYWDSYQEKILEEDEDAGG